MVIQFEDEQQLKQVTQVVKSIAGIYDHSAVECLSTLTNKLEKCTGMIDLLEDHRDNDDYNEVICLFNIMKVIVDVGADEYNACGDIYTELKKRTSSSDVPRFLEMLRDYHVPAEYCTDLFKNWCSGEGTAVLAEDCLGIQTAHNIIMTPVWNWVCNNDASSETDWIEEVNKYKEAING